MSTGKTLHTNNHIITILVYCQGNSFHTVKFPSVENNECDHQSVKTYALDDRSILFYTLASTTKLILATAPMTAYVYVYSVFIEACSYLKVEYMSNIWRSSLIIGICPVASTRKHVLILMSFPNKKSIV